MLWTGFVLGVMTMCVWDSLSALREIKRHERKTAEILERI